LSKIILGLLLVGSLILVCSSSLGSCDDSSGMIPFNFDELTAQIKVKSPIQDQNFTYGSDILVDVFVHLGGTEYEQGLHYIPIQNISCVYSLDNSEWQNLTLVSFKESPPFASYVNKWYYKVMDINYTTTLQNITGGLHFLKIAMKPDGIFFSGLYGNVGCPIVSFNVTDEPQTNSNESLIIGSIIGVASISCVLLYFKKIKIPLSSNYSK
jgi:hypothetical protein